MENIFEEKAVLRKKIRGEMRKLDPALRKDIDVAICRNVCLLTKYALSNTVFCFVGTDWEIDTKPLINSALLTAKRVAVPLCTGPGIMEARFIHSLGDLKPGAYGIPEPSQNCPICPPEEIEFAVIPCVSCDPSCLRLGQGGGFYDRFMEKSTFFTAALCREAALLEHVPTEPWDRPVDCVVTESHTYFRKP